MKKKTEKTLISLFALAAACVYMPLTAVAGEGWTESDGQWRYLNSQGEAITSTWKASNDIKYYLSSDGYMLKNTFIQDGSDLYYVDENGAMAVNRWVYGQADEYDLESYWYYFGSNGKAFRKSGQEIKKSVNGKNYAFDDNGKMLTGLLDENGQVLESDSDPFLSAIYFAGEDGALYTNQWYRYEGFVSNDAKSEASESFYTNYPSIWLRFDANSKKIKAGTDKTLSERNIDGVSYGFDTNGVMIDGFVTNTNGSRKYFSGYDGGVMFANKWLWIYPSEVMDEEDNTNEECSWFYTDSSGKVYQNAVKTINGRKYAFDNIGRMQTGFVLFGNETDNKQMVASYEIDQLSSDDFKNGTSGLPGIERADLYLFGPNELNDGSMLSGNNIEVQLDDGVFTFGFQSNGKAYGNKNLLEKHSDAYYINGLKLKADNEYGYGVVGAEKNGTVKYKLVDPNGKIVNGKKNIIKSKQGDWILLINDDFKAMVSTSEKPRWTTKDGVAGFYEYDAKEKTYGDLIAEANTVPEAGLSDLLIYEGAAK